jgi:hypothetical protein
MKVFYNVKPKVMPELLSETIGEGPIMALTTFFKKNMILSGMGNKVTASFKG